MPLDVTPPAKVKVTGKEISIFSLGREWRLRRDANLDELWERMGTTDFADERIPYWTELWPSSLALAQWLYSKKMHIENRICLELGCGLGFTALVGAWLGASVIASDYELPALKNCLTNATLNDGQTPEWICMDWRNPAVAQDCFNFVWAADIIYEKRNIAPVLKLLCHCLAPEGLAWLADPGRGVFRAFLEEGRTEGFCISEAAVIRAASLYPENPAVDISIWEVRRR